MKIKLSAYILLLVGIGAVGALAVGRQSFPEVFSGGGCREKSEELFTNQEVLQVNLEKCGLRKTMLHLHDLSTTIGSCHNVAHEAGKLAYEMFGDQAFEQCTDYCQSGCYHGAIGGYFREHGTVNLEKNLKNICGGDMSDFVRLQCFHGVGHGLTAWVDYNLPEALRACELLQEGTPYCFTGVFMENIIAGVPLEEFKKGNVPIEAHVTTFLNGDPHYPCNAVAESYRAACYYMQTTRMTKLYSGDFLKVAHECLRAPKEYRLNCFESMGRDIGSQPQDDPVGAIEKCKVVPYGENRTNCLMGVVDDLFWDHTQQDAAIGFCGLFSDNSEKISCYKRISLRASQLFKSGGERYQFCKKIDTVYQSLCSSTAP